MDEIRSTLLQMRNISKSFPGVKALDNVNLVLGKNELLGVVGENGAGKSTLLKILSGVFRADAGEILLENTKKDFFDPSDAIKAGISVIHQELSYVSNLTVAENIFLGRQPTSGIIKKVDWKTMFKMADDELAKVGIDISSKAIIKDLSVAQKQLVEIVKALSYKSRILIMDEPTSSLGIEETDNLLKIVKNLPEQGISVIFISHRIDEVLNIADRIMVLRDGKKVGELLSTEATQKKVISLMVGRSISDMYPKEFNQIGNTILMVENLQSQYLQSISFKVNKGEVLGLFGMMGSGRTEVLEAVFGAKKTYSKNIYIENRAVQINSPEDAVKAGIAYVPAERKTSGLILVQKIRQNITTASLDKIHRFGIIDSKKERKTAEKWVRNLNIKAPGINTLVESLSGGNQQKVVVAKWLETAPKVLFLNEPTRGIDVGAKVEVYRIIEDLCKSGIGVVIISSDMLEILNLSDRIIVLASGRITGEFDRKEAVQEKLMYAAIGSKNE